MNNTHGLHRTRSMKRTVSANQRRMISVLSQQNCLNLGPSNKNTEKTLDKKMSTVNLMFLEDVLEDIESNAKKMHQDINKSLHNLKNLQYEKEKEKEKEVESSSNDSDNYSEAAEEIDSNSYDFGGDTRLQSFGSFESVSDQDGVEATLRLSQEAKKQKIAAQKLQRMDSEVDVNAQPGVPFTANSFLVKKKTKACNKAVRLALLEAGPFRQLMKEGVKVIVHFLRQGETRVTRVQRIMIWLDDDEVEQQGGESNVQDREFFDMDADSSEEEVDFDDDGQDKLNLFGFFKMDQNGILESSTNLSDINEIATVFMGANTSVFRRSLDHLHGEHKSYDRSEHSNRCFSLVGCKSPFDDRCCLDIEILPRDKQKPEEIHAACMIAYGIATSFQVLSNLSNKSEMTVREEALERLSQPEVDEEDEEDEDEDEEGGREEREAKRLQERRFRHLFPGGRLPNKKLTVNYLMEEVIANIPSPAEHGK